jgi:hypothetical protein
MGEGDEEEEEEEEEFIRNPKRSKEKEQGRTDHVKHWPKISLMKT